MSEVHYRGGPLGWPYPRGQAKPPRQTGSDRGGSLTMNLDDVQMFGDRVRCPKCKELVRIPTDAPIDATDMRQIDFVMEQIRPRLERECPNHER